jgi:hypothetical protein
MMPTRLTAAVLIVSAGLTCGRVEAATFCVSNGAELRQALISSTLNNEADVIRLQTGNYTSSQPQGFTADVSNGGLELSGGWGAGCLIRSRSARSTIDGQYQRPGMFINGNLVANRTVRITQLAFVRGVGADFGGLMVNALGQGDMRVEIERNRFHDNHNTDVDDYLGGGLLVTADDIKVYGNLFTGNHAGVGGGAAALNCIGTTMPGAFTSNTVVLNTAAFGQANDIGGVTLFGSCQWEIANNILWDNEGYDLRIPDNRATLRNNNLEDLFGTPFASSGNIAVDPMFVATGNLRLKRASPLVDAGFDEVFLGLPQYSYDGGIRIAGPRIDIGAYELDILFDHGFDPLFVGSSEGDLR